MSVKLDSDGDILSPLGRLRRALHRPAPRLARLDGMTIGLLDNSKPNANLVLDEIGQGLLERGAIKIVYRRKPTAAMPAGLLLDELALGCDAVINGHGDCGSCTSWCVHDSVELERRGIPVATINTTEFAGLGRFEAIALGLPSLPIVTIAHPIASISAPLARERGREAIAAVIEALCTDFSEAGQLPSRTSSVVGAEPETVDCGCAI